MFQVRLEKLKPFSIIVCAIDADGRKPPAFRRGYVFFMFLTKESIEPSPEETDVAADVDQKLR